MLNYNWVTLGDVFRPFVIKHIVLICVVYDGTNYNTSCKRLRYTGNVGAELLCELRTGSCSQAVPSAQEQIRCNMPSKNIDRDISTIIRLASVASHCVFLQVRVTEEEEIR